MWEFNNVLEELSIPIISTNTRFWLVRTNGGDYYLDMVKVKHNLSLFKELDEAKRQLDESKKILHSDNVEHSEPVVTPKRWSRK